MQDNNKFDFTYSAPTDRERREIESIRRQYITREPEKSGGAARIKELHMRVTGYSTAASLALGVVGILVFGLGMAMALEWAMYLVGCILGVAGAALMISAYPVYLYVYNKMKKKHADEIIRLSDALLGEAEE